MPTIYTDQDANPAVLRNRTVAILGYGNQGRAQALNLRDSGVQVIVGQREPSPRHALAKTDGFAVLPAAEAVARATIHHMLVPDESQGELFLAIRGALKPRDTLVFATGYAIHFRQIEPPADCDVILVAPKGPGLLLRSAYVAGSGIFSLVGVHQDASGGALATALALSQALGCTRIAALAASFREEAETDLFGEQVVLCGGVTELAKQAFQTLLDAGYPPELAYIECVHELKQCVDLLWSGGLAKFWDSISDTAEYGAATRGPRLITGDTRATMDAILREIQSGQFAREWQAEAARGKPGLQALEQADSASSLQRAGDAIRKLLQRGPARTDM